jgi:hypothetical protein
VNISESQSDSDEGERTTAVTVVVGKHLSILSRLSEGVEDSEAAESAAGVLDLIDKAAGQLFNTNNLNIGSNSLGLFDTKQPSASNSTTTSPSQSRSNSLVNDSSLRVLPPRLQSSSHEDEEDDEGGDLVRPLRNSAHNNHQRSGRLLSMMSTTSTRDTDTTGQNLAE